MRERSLGWLCLAGRRGRSRLTRRAVPAGPASRRRWSGSDRRDTCGGPPSSRVGDHDAAPNHVCSFDGPPRSLSQLSEMKRFSSVSGSIGNLGSCLPSCLSVLSHFSYAVRQGYKSPTLHKLHPMLFLAIQRPYRLPGKPQPGLNAAYGPPI